jgi:hypothetical protein
MSEISDVTSIEGLPVPSPVLDVGTGRMENGCTGEDAERVYVF